MLVDIKREELQIQSILIAKGVLAFRAINHKRRQEILRLLHDKKRMIVTDVYVKLRLEQSATSQHLAILRKAGFVKTEREGKCIYYSVDYTKLTAFQTIVEDFIKKP